MNPFANPPPRRWPVSSFGFNQKLGFGHDKNKDSRDAAAARIPRSARGKSLELLSLKRPFAALTQSRALTLRRCAPAAAQGRDRGRRVPADPRPRAGPDRPTASAPQSLAAGVRRAGPSL